MTCPDESIVGFNEPDMNVSFADSMLDTCISECTNLNFGFGGNEDNGIIG